jgi:spore germination cell wall hydrolase CwlJ-like protein
VQSVFDAQRSEHQAQMKERMSNRLTQLVTDKKITEAQKNLIIAKHDAMQKEMQTMRDQMKDKTPEERRALMETKRVELEKWAKDNGIDLQYLKPFGPGKGMHKGFKGMHGDR